MGPVLSRRIDEMGKNCQQNYMGLTRGSERAIGAAGAVFSQMHAALAKPQAEKQLAGRFRGERAGGFISIGLARKR